MWTCDSATLSTESYDLASFYETSFFDFEAAKVVVAAIDPLAMIDDDRSSCIVALFYKHHFSIVDSTDGGADFCFEIGAWVVTFKLAVEESRDAKGIGDVGV